MLSWTRGRDEWLTVLDDAEWIGTLREKNKLLDSTMRPSSWEFSQGPNRTMGGGRAKTASVDCRNAAHTLSTLGRPSRIEIFNKHLLGTSEKSCLHFCLPLLYYLLTPWALEIWLLPPLSLRLLWKVPLSFAWTIWCVDPSLLLWFFSIPCTLLNSFWFFGCSFSEPTVPSITEKSSKDLPWFLFSFDPLLHSHGFSSHLFDNFQISLSSLGFSLALQTSILHCLLDIRMSHKHFKFRIPILNSLSPLFIICFLFLDPYLCEGPHQPWNY